MDGLEPTEHDFTKMPIDLDRLLKEHKTKFTPAENEISGTP